MFKEQAKQSDQTQTVIGGSVSVEGDFEGKGDVLVEGKLKGTLKTEQNLTVGDHAEIEANVTARNAHIAGIVKGDITIAEKITLTNTANIIGNITAKFISIEEGAQFNGQCATQNNSNDTTPDTTEDVQ